MLFLFIYLWLVCTIPKYLWNYERICWQSCTALKMSSFGLVWSLFTVDWFWLRKDILTLRDIYTWNSTALAIPLEINTLNLIAISEKSWNYFKIDLLNPLSTLNVILLLDAVEGIWCFLMYRFICSLALNPAVVWAHLPDPLHWHWGLLREFSWDFFWMRPT